MVGPAGALVAGLVLTTAGLLTPSTTLVRVLRTPPAELEQRLILGAECFRIGLVLLGGGVLYLGWFSSAYPVRIGARRTVRRGGRSGRAALFVILVVALMLRLYRLDSPLWLDEIMTYVRYSWMTLGEVVTTYDSQNQHFLYTLLAKLSVSIMGNGPGSLRLPAALFGVASVWALYRLGSYVADASQARLAAGLLAVSYHHVWFSQDARGYTGLLFWTLLTSWLLLRALDDERPRWWIAYAVAAALGAYTHATMLFVIAGQLVIYAYRVVRHGGTSLAPRVMGLLFGFGLCALLCFQLYALVLPQIVDVTLEEGRGGQIGVWTSPGWVAAEFGLAMATAFRHPVIAVLVLLLGVAGSFRLARRAPVVLALGALPVIIAAGVVVGLGHHIWPRFFFFAMGFGALAVVSGAGALSETGLRALGVGPRGRAAGGIGLSVLLMLVAASALPDVYGPKQDYRGALDFVERMRRPGDSVVSAGLAVVPYRDYFGTDWQPIDSVEALDAARRRAARTWLIYTMPAELRGLHPAISEVIRRDFVVVKRFEGTLHDGTIFVCRFDRGWPGVTMSDANGQGVQWISHTSTTEENDK